MKYTHFALVFIPLFANATDNVEIYGAAQTSNGKETTAEFSFPEENVEIVPIVEKENVPSQAQNIPQKASVENLKEIHQISNQNPKPFSISPQAEQNQIENTLYEGGNRIYDVQSFPLKDIKTITEPNLDPTISTYPEY